MKIITLTTDFGQADWFVGAMKGVILTINPAVRLVDIAHDIPAGDVAAGAFALTAAYRFFPRGTIHVAVVDPGVGGSRSALAVKTSRCLLVGPDNGVLSLALRREKIRAIHRLENRAYFLAERSRTFHGRDLFAPVAAALSKGTPIRRLGPAVAGFVKLAWPEPTRTGDGLRGQIVYLDRFGNGITNIAAEQLSDGLWGRAVASARRTRFPLETHYQAVASGRPVAVIGSTGFLELALNGGSAAGKLGLKVGQPVRLALRRERHVP
jgi:hypothetical protein